MAHYHTRAVVDLQFVNTHLNVPKIQVGRAEEGRKALGVEGLATLVEQMVLEKPKVDMAVAKDDEVIEGKHRGIFVDLEKVGVGIKD